MAGEQSLVDQIVNGVLKQLGTADGGDARGKSARTASPTKSTTSRQGVVELAEIVVTADVVTENIGQAGTVSIPGKSIITPAAWDVIKELGLKVERPSQKSDGTKKSTESGAVPTSTANRLLIVVRHTDAVDRLWQDLQAAWRRELLGCPDDAAGLAISELSRGESGSVVILAEQSHRAACLANRHKSVKAAAVRDAADIKAINKQMKTNVWCVDPTGKSWFELKNLFRAIV